MISVTDLRAGTTFVLDNQPFQVIKYEHSKIGRGTANIKIKARNLNTGAIVDKTFISGAKIEPISTRKIKMQYLYQEGGDFYFMDPKTFEQTSVEGKSLGEQKQFLKEGEEVYILFWDKKALGLDLPPSLVFKVKKTDPGVKGNSATNIWKSATLENGVNIKVPLFIKEGEMIKVDTRTSEYLERAKK